MATIGHFHKTKNGFEGTISTLSLARKVQFISNTNKKSDASPDYFIKTGQCDLGVAWRDTSKTKNPTNYIRVLLDDPSFTGPVNAALFEQNGKADLVWTRKQTTRTNQPA